MTLHELGVTESLLKTCLSEAERRNLTKITAIYLKTGLFSGIEPECIQVYMDMLSEGTAAEGAKIYSETLPAKITCRDCGFEEETLRAVTMCPVCGSRHLKISSGTEFIIDKIEAESAP